MPFARLSSASRALTGSAALAVFGALTLVASTGPAQAASSTSTTTPKSLVSTAVNAAKKQTSVHYVAFSKQGSESISLTADAATSTGKQVIAIRSGSHRGAVTGLLADGNAYYRGDKYGLTTYLGMPSSIAPKYAGQWIEFTPSDSNFTQIEKSFAVSSAVSEASISGPYSSAGRSEVNGTAVVGVKGKTSTLSASGSKKGSAVLYVSAGTNPLPVRFTGSGTQKNGKTATGRLDFSHWGESVSVQAPSKSVKASSISSGNSSSSGQ